MQILIVESTFDGQLSPLTFTPARNCRTACWKRCRRHHTWGGNPTCSRKTCENRRSLQPPAPRDVGDAELVRFSLPTVLVPVL